MSYKIIHAKNYHDSYGMKVKHLIFEVDECKRTIIRETSVERKYFLKFPKILFNILINEDDKNAYSYSFLIDDKSYYPLLPNTNRYYLCLGNNIVKYHDDDNKSICNFLDVFWNSKFNSENCCNFILIDKLKTISDFLIDWEKLSKNNDWTYNLSLTEVIEDGKDKNKLDINYLGYCEDNETVVKRIKSFDVHRYELLFESTNEIKDFKYFSNSRIIIYNDENIEDRIERNSVKYSYDEYYNLFNKCILNINKLINKDFLNPNLNEIKIKAFIDNAWKISCVYPKNYLMNHIVNNTAVYDELLNLLNLQNQITSKKLIKDILVYQI